LSNDEVAEARRLHLLAVAMADRIQLTAGFVGARGDVALDALAMLMAQALAQAPEDERPSYVFGVMERITRYLNDIISGDTASATEQLNGAAEDTKH
jgi:hypothetical protein